MLSATKINKLKTVKGNAIKSPAVKKAIKLHEENPNMSYQAIADATGRNKSTVWRTLKRYNIQKKKTESFKADRADIFAGTQANILEEMNTPEKIAKASLRDLTIAAGTLYHKERLERGQSTENIQLAGVIERIDRKTREENDEKPV
ncbi:MAG: helix-turn-helix domain-containing protein [Deltaproteobacteria bacterium]|nr:helix-turn-helix domain-containing protein [Deltaproteobacteria bacterium]